MNQKIDEFHLAAWRAFLNAHAALINRIEKEMTEAGCLPLSSYDVLVALSESPERRLRMHELADRVVLSRSGLTRLVDRLENDGLLKRDRSARDRRGAYAVLTEEGLEEVRRSWPVYARGILQHFANLLADQEVTIITQALGRVSEAARQPDEPAK